MLDEKRVSGSAVVIGAGTMGGGIAAQLANAGWHVDLLDVAASGAGERSAAAIAGVDRVVKARPPLLFLPEFADRIETGNIEDDLECLKSADWVVEAVAERMDVKQGVLAQIEAHAGADTVVTSNTSGLSLRQMVGGRSASFRSRFLGSHFLNPPRYLKLLEVVPLEETDPEVAAGFVRFAEQVLGHRVVIAKDTPGFISTRLWIEHLLATMHLAIEHDLTVEETDYLTGSLLGRPRSATFRMGDIVGLDIVSTIAKNQFEALPNDPYRDLLTPPGIVQQLLSSGRLGDKTGGGFYKRESGGLLAVDLSTGEYRPRQEVRIEDVERLGKLSIRERIAGFKDMESSRHGRFLNSVLDSLSAYVGFAGPEIASDVLAVDNVMRWGFQWELGPNEIQDLREEAPRSYSGTGSQRRFRVYGSNAMQPVRAEVGYLTLAELKWASKTIFEEDAGALVDMGEGVACFEFRTKMGTLNPSLCALLNRARETAERDFRAMVIGGDGSHFSVGYDLRMLVEAAESKDWAGINAKIAEVQQTFIALKYSPILIVAAVRGYALGGGCECALHCAAIQAAPESMFGLPERTVGLVPAGGGIKELLARTTFEWKGDFDILPALEKAFRQIAVEGRSGNAEEARKAGYLRDRDVISRNADRLLFDAKANAIALADSGYLSPERRGIRVPGRSARERLIAIAAGQLDAGNFTPYDKAIAEEIAEIMTHTGDGPKQISENILLDLERDTLLALVRDPRTIARMKVLLETGKPLRN